MRKKEYSLKDLKKLLFKLDKKMQVQLKPKASEIALMERVSS